VIFGVAANVSISKLFMAGIVPGLIWGGAVVTWWWLARKETVAPPPRKSRAEVLAGLRRAPGRWCCRSSSSSA
jgi:TRAP-type C4-dicarboxylate transport system permease large subunit